MIEEVAIDRNVEVFDVERSDTEPFRVSVAGRFIERTLAHEDDVSHDGRAFAFECVGGQADRPDEIGFRSDILAEGRVLLVEREVTGDQGENRAGLERVHGPSEEVVMEGELLAAVFKFDIGEGYIADYRVDAVIGQACVAEVFDANV